MSVAVVLVTQTDIKEWWGRGQLLGGGGRGGRQFEGGRCTHFIVRLSMKVVFIMVMFLLPSKLHVLTEIIILKMYLNVHVITTCSFQHSGQH